MHTARHLNLFLFFTLNHQFNDLPKKRSEKVIKKEIENRQASSINSGREMSAGNSRGINIKKSLKSINKQQSQTLTEGEGMRNN